MTSQSLSIMIRETTVYIAIEIAEAVTVIVRLFCGMALHLYLVRSME